MINMTNDYEFSSVMLIRNAEMYLKEAIESVISQNIGFKEHIQLILVVNESVDDSKEIALEYQRQYPENILVLENEKSDYASSRNLAINHIKGRYVNFFEANDCYEDTLVKTVHRFFKKHEDDVDIVTVPVSVFSEKAIDPPKFCEENVFDLNNLKEDEFIPSTYLHSSFIKASVLDGFEFPENLFAAEDKFLINKIFIDKPFLGTVKGTRYFFRKRPKTEKDYLTSEFYMNRFELYFNPLIDYAHEKLGHLPSFTKFLILKEFERYINIENLEDVFEPQDIDKFWKYFKNFLDQYSVEEILERKRIKRYIKAFWIYFKNDRDFKIETKSNPDEVLIKTGDYEINNLRLHTLNIDIVELLEDEINLTASITSCCYPENLSLQAVKKTDEKREIFNGKYVDYPTTARKSKRILGIDWEFTNHFDISIPINGTEPFTIDFEFIYEEGGKPVVMSNHVEFRKFAGLSNLGNFTVKHSKILAFRGRTFYLMPYSYPKMLKFEFKNLIRILRNHKPMFLTAIFYRIIFTLFYPFTKNRKIWLFIDRDYVADDNAEFLYKYCVKQDDGIEKYFIIDKESPDFERMRETNDNIIPFGSFKHKMLYLFSQKIMSSQLTRRIINPFTFKNSSFYEGASNYDYCFLQHGVILHDLSSWIRKYNKNLYLFVTSADAERDSIVNGHYNYDADRVQALGLSRYDNLESDSKKEILFIPTWRRHLNTKEAIINSDYLESMNSFLNNEKLIKYVNDHGYKLVFRPHPDLWKFIDLFDINENFRIAEESYQQLFKTSSVMITDYSSVAFDFAYLKKPLIYYHRESFEEFHYNLGYFDYETMGFGDVVRNEDDLVSKVIEYIDNDCKMEDEYKSRVSRFFKYNDRNNCKRIYDWLINH